MIGETVPKIETGVIHGRFQVFHNDHLKYLLAGMGSVGIWSGNLQTRTRSYH
jgi:hypothetical protein